MLWAAYLTFVPQLVAAVLLAGMLFQRVDRLWEFAFHFHFCLLVTLLVFALFPAATAAQHYGLAPTIDESRSSHISRPSGRARSHTIRFGELEGLVSMPSFHAAAAFMVTWAFRGYRRTFRLFACLNALLTLSTFVTGVHFFVDVLGAVVLFATSLAVYRLVIAPMSSLP